MKNELNHALQFRDARHDESQPPAGNGPVPSDPWITDELLRHTQQVWSEVSGRVIPVEEAIEILQNVKGLADVLWDIMQKRESS
jgi:hypothetical protein